jgi:GNAT superfamily N-acetyltransferase
MEIQKLEKGNAKQIRLFKRLPSYLYQGNPFWVPPFPGEIESVMELNKHPYYAHSEADFFIVKDNGKTLGRIAVLHNRNFCEFHQVKTGFFYYFESIEDTNVASLLFKTAEDWCRERGLTQIMGPRGFLRSNGTGLLIEGFDQLPAVGIAYNPPYYKDLIESSGFIKSHDHLSGYLDRHPDTKIHTIAAKVLSRGNFRVLNFKKKDQLLEWLPLIEDTQKKAFESNPNEYPSTPEELALQAKTILTIADPKFIKIILHQNDVAGFIIAYPNLNHALIRCKGRFFPYGWMFLLNEKRHPILLDINGVGLLPQYQGLGGNALLYSELDKVVTQSRRIKRAEIVQVDERNLRSMADMEAIGVRFSKIHRTYFKDL